MRERGGEGAEHKRRGRESACLNGKRCCSFMCKGEAETSWWGGQGCRVTITGAFFFFKKKGITRRVSSSNWKIANVLPVFKDSRLVPLSFLSFLW